MAMQMFSQNSRGFFPYVLPDRFPLYLTHDEPFSNCLQTFVLKFICKIQKEFQRGRGVVVGSTWSWLFDIHGNIIGPTWYISIRKTSGLWNGTPSTGFPFDTWGQWRLLSISDSSEKNMLDWTWWGAGKRGEAIDDRSLETVAEDQALWVATTVVLAGFFTNWTSQRWLPSFGTTENLIKKIIGIFADWTKVARAERFSWWKIWTKNFRRGVRRAAFRGKKRKENKTKWLGFFFLRSYLFLRCSGKFQAKNPFEVISF